MHTTSMQVLAIIFLQELTRHDARTEWLLYSTIRKEKTMHNNHSINIINKHDYRNQSSTNKLTLLIIKLRVYMIVRYNIHLNIFMSNLRQVKRFRGILFLWMVYLDVFLLLLRIRDGGGELIKFSQSIANPTHTQMHLV